MPSKRFSIKFIHKNSFQRYFQNLLLIFIYNKGIYSRTEEICHRVICAAKSSASRLCYYPLLYASFIFKPYYPEH